jgi:hypothetical protein
MKRNTLIFFSLISCSLIISISQAQDSFFGFKPIFQVGSPLSHFQSDKQMISVFPEGLYGGQRSGFIFGAKLKPAIVKTISYEVMFNKDFDFVRGGKLPGLCGGKKATGGVRATGKSGFSARIMWRKSGRVVSYVYHANQKGKYGDDFQWRNPTSDKLFFIPGQWHKIVFTVRMNDPNKKNGEIIGYFDGKIAYQNKNFVFRTTNDFKIDRLCFHTFFGGDDLTWAPKKEENLFIKNLIISNQ